MYSSKTLKQLKIFIFICYFKQLLGFFKNSRKDKIKILNFLKFESYFLPHSLNFYNQISSSCINLRKSTVSTVTLCTVQSSSWRAFFLRRLETLFFKISKNMMIKVPSDQTRKSLQKERNKRRIIVSEDTREINR